MDARRRVCLGSVVATCLGLTVAPVFAQAKDEPGYVVRPWPRDKDVPPLPAGALDGKAPSLADLRGQVVMLNFWATWCEPCRAEMPSLQRLANSHAAQGLRVFAVNYQERPDTIRRFVEKLDLRLPVLLDADGAAARAWTPRIFPSTVVLARDGRPAFTLVGEADWGSAEVARLLAPLLDSGAPAGRRKV